MDDSQKTTQQTTFPTDDPVQNSSHHQGNPGQTQSTHPSVAVQPQPTLGQNPTTSQVAQPPEEKKIPEAPVSAPSKEGGPSFPSGHEKFVKPSTPDMEISHELQEAGVEVKMERPELTPADADKEVILHAKESVPVVVSDQPNIQLPMTQQQAQQTIKLHKKVKDSLYWLAMLIARQWQIKSSNKVSK